MDSKILEENASVSAEVILVDKNQPFKNPNYSLCEHSKKYLVYVKSKKLNEICQNYEIELGLLK
jgi:hypothetical protein